MTDVYFHEGDRVKVAFEATVIFPNMGAIEYIKFDNDKELEFPSDYVGGSVTFEKIEKPVEEGWWEVRWKDCPQPDFTVVRWYQGGNWYLSPADAENENYRLEAPTNVITYFGKGSLA